MKRIGLISDTHAYLDEKIFSHFNNCDEIWHAGDFGNISIANELEDKTGLPVRGVYGNIDGQDVRVIFPEEISFDCEGVRVYMKHIGGYPGRYAPGVRQRIIEEKAQLFISGHSHILKVQFDPSLQCLHINPGAAGKQGWHVKRTIMRFVIDGRNIRDCEVIELGERAGSRAIS